MLRSENGSETSLGADSAGHGNEFPMDLCPQIIQEQPQIPRRIQESAEEPATTSTPSSIDIEEDTLEQPRLQ